MRFKRYGELFKICHSLSIDGSDGSKSGDEHKHAVDMYNVFYEKGVKMLVSPQLRRDLIQLCYPEYFEDTSKITEDPSW